MMTPLLTVCKYGTVAMVVLQVFFEYRKYKGASSVPVGVTKTLASAGFVGAAYCAGAAHAMPAQLVFVALCLCVVGDVLLIFKERTCFVGGLIAFLVGHVVYIAFFIERGILLIPLLCAAPVLIIAGLIIYKWLWPSLLKPLRVPVGLYVITICTMTTVAWSSFVYGTHLLLLVAAILFMVSDVLVARDRFIASGFINRAISLPLYYAAQLLFASFAASG